MTTSPYARIGAKLVDNGYSAIPCAPGTKIPGSCNFGEWWPTTSWDRYCDRLPTEHETSVWEQWPDAGVCVACNHTLKVIDIDTDDPELRAAILAAIPQSAVAKIGSKGLSLFYRGSAAIEPRSFNVPGHGRVIDLIAYGKQTVIPPTIHPGTGKPYYWQDPSETLESTPPESLPELPDDIVERLAAALEPYGYSAPVERDPVQGDADSAWREVNNIALSRLADWVPDLDLPRMKASRGGYRAVAAYRPSGSGKPMEKRNLHLSIHQTGIVDYGDNDATYTPISLVMQVHRCNFGDAFDWLRDRLDLRPRAIDVSALIANGLAKRGVVTVTQEQADAHAAGLPGCEVVDPETGEVLDGGESTSLQKVQTSPLVLAAAPAPRAPANDNGLPDDLTRVPGLVGDITRWILHTSRNPTPTLALGAALAFVGALAGRRYAGPTGLRTNVYIVGLAGSGYGKDHPRKAIRALAHEANVLGRFFGGNKIASSSALRNRVKKNPSVLYMIDEFGGAIRKWTGHKSGNHEKEIAEDLLEMTGTAESVFMGADYAQNLAEPIYSPNVCISGTSAPETFWAALGSGNISDGFLPRFIVLDAGSTRPEPRDALGSVEQVPRALTDAVQAVVIHPNGGNLNGMTSDGTQPIVPISVPYGPGAKEVFDGFVKEMYAHLDKAPVEFEPIYARVAENAGRLALIVAVGVGPRAPVITRDIMEWAAGVAFASSQMLIKQANDRVADNDRQAEYKRIRAIIAEQGKRGATRTDIARRLRGSIDKRRTQDVVDQLVEAAEVVRLAVQTGRQGRPTERLYLAGLEPTAEQEEAA